MSFVAIGREMNPWFPTKSIPSSATVGPAHESLRLIGCLRASRWCYGLSVRGGDNRSVPRRRRMDCHRPGRRRGDVYACDLPGRPEAHPAGLRYERRLPVNRRWQELGDDPLPVPDGLDERAPGVASHRPGGRLRREWLARVPEDDEGRRKNLGQPAGRSVVRRRNRDRPRPSRTDAARQPPRDRPLDGRRQELDRSRDGSRSRAWLPFRSDEPGRDSYVLRGHRSGCLSIRRWGDLLARSRGSVRTGTDRLLRRWIEPAERDLRPLLLGREPRASGTDHRRDLPI